MRLLKRVSSFSDKSGCISDLILLEMYVCRAHL
jgi:hypothetical protein